MNKGYVNLYRELKDKSIWIESTPEQAKILITLLLMANHAQNRWEFKGQQFTCKPGQLITSLESIVKNAGKGISIRNTRTALKRFEKLGFLTNESTKQNRLITICNWSTYQAKKKATDNQADNQPTNDRQTGDNQPTTNNNVLKNEENEKDILLVESHIFFNEFTEYQKWLKLTGDNVAKLDKQLTIDQYTKLVTKYGKQSVMDIIIAMNNYKPLTKKCNSVHDTATTWINNNLKKTA